MPRRDRAALGRRRDGARPPSSTSPTSASGTSRRATDSASASPTPSSARPPIVILDEPTAGLDPNQIRDVRAARARARPRPHGRPLDAHPERGRGVRHARLLIHRGRLVAEGPTGEIRALRGGTRSSSSLRGDAATRRASARGVEGVRAERDAAADGTPRRARDVSRLRVTFAEPGQRRDRRGARTRGRAVRRGARRRGDRRARGPRRGRSLEEVFASLTPRRPRANRPPRRPPATGVVRRRREVVLADLQARALRVLRDAAGVGAHRRLPAHAGDALLPPRRPFSRSGPELAGDETPLSAFFGNTVLLYLVLFVLVPPMTMRLFAEERRSGTIETLMTAPVSSAAVVLAKYAAVLTTYVAMWLPTVLYLVILRRADRAAARLARRGERVPRRVPRRRRLPGRRPLRERADAIAVSRHDLHGAGPARRSSSSASASSSPARGRRSTTSAPTSRCGRT